MRRDAVRALTILVLGGVVGLVAGCAEQHVNGDTSTYKYESWMGPTAIVAGVAALPVGLIIMRRTERWGKRWLQGAILAFGVPLLVIALAPGLFTDRVIVDPQHFDARFGIWFAPQQFHIKFDDLSSMELRGTVKRGRRGRKTTEYKLHCQRKSGESVTVPVGDLMKAAIGQIMENAQEHGVAVTQVEPPDAG